jgi:hypothetical protein
MVFLKQLRMVSTFTQIYQGLSILNKNFQPQVPELMIPHQYASA